MITFQDTSFLKTEKDVSLFFESRETIPITLDLDAEKFYFQHLHASFLLETLHFPVRNNQITPFLIFVRYLLRSNLCFDIAFSLPIQHKQSKIALMYGDYFLSKAGAYFQPFLDYILLRKLLVNTLKRISKSQWLQPVSITSRSDFYRMVNLRYGSVFQFCMKAPLLMNHQAQAWEKNKALKANALALYCTFLKNSPLTNLYKQKQSKNFELFRLRKYLDL